MATSAITFSTQIKLAVSLLALSLLSGCFGKSVGSRADIEALIDSGDFAKARTAIADMVKHTTDEAEQKKLAFELERMRRIEKDFSADKNDLLNYLNKHIPDLTKQEFEQWLAQDQFEYRILDNEKRYFKSAGYNLFQLNDDAKKRRANYQSFTELAPLYALHDHHAEVLNQAKLNPDLQGPSKRFLVNYSVTLKADQVPAGETVRAWLPYPREVAGRQSNITLVGSTPQTHKIADNNQLQRTIYFEQKAVAGEELTFNVSYQYDSTAFAAVIDSEKVTAIKNPDTLQAYLTEEAPHIVFTPEMKALSQQIVGNETNPYRIAQKLFAYVDNIPWATALEYSTIRNLAEYAATAGHADCGQQTMLLITLLRLNGIPARWQSGWEFSPTQFDTMHDWGMVYFEPYGWVPMDVTHGVLNSDDDALKWFYLGSIDSYRLIFNDAYSQPFSPAKIHFRSETVDSQRGELEWDGGNLYFDQWRYHMDWQEIPNDSFSVSAMDSQQVVMVITPDKDSISGELFTFEREAHGNWQAATLTTPIVVGRTGIAWGKGLHPAQPGVQKQEGDGKAPAGVFTLGTAFGYLDNLKTQLPYSPMTDADFCIDVPGSPLYNQIVSTTEVGVDAIEGSTEPMRRDIHNNNDHVYKKGIVVNHNPQNIDKAGSCIFVHLWRAADKPTAGCTAMPELAIDQLLSWLDATRNPLFITLTKDDYRELKQRWQLPDVELVSN